MRRIGQNPQAGDCLRIVFLDGNGVTETCEEVLLDHAIVEYTGGLVMQDSPSAVRGIYTPGDDLGPQFTSVNVDGRYVIVNSTLRYGASDAVYLMGGSAIIKDNIFAGNGADGGEAVNVKAGCKVDVSGNIMYSPNTNGLKLSSSGQNDEGGRAQAEVRAYNNAIINAGWRRDGTKGGSVYVEKLGGIKENPSGFLICGRLRIVDD